MSLSLTLKMEKNTTPRGNTRENTGNISPREGKGRRAAAPIQQQSEESFSSVESFNSEEEEGGEQFSDVKEEVKEKKGKRERTKPEMIERNESLLSSEDLAAIRRQLSRLQSLEEMNQFTEMNIDVVTATKSDFVDNRYNRTEVTNTSHSFWSFLIHLRH